MRAIIGLSILAWCLVLSGCGGGPKSGKGFTLPDGDIKRGEAAFTNFRCHECHTVRGVSLPKLDTETTDRIPRGGEVNRIETYGQLVTSTINPSHKLAKGFPQERIANGDQSKMKNYNDVLTVSELIDLVDFLQSHYRLKPQDPTDYPFNLCR